MILRLSLAGLLAAAMPGAPLRADLTLAPVPPPAMARVSAVQVRVAPDHRDWTYAPGEPARFTVTVTADQTAIDGAAVTYTVGPELQPAEPRTAAVPEGGLVIEGGTLREPGFLRCAVSLEVAGRTYRGVATAAFAPERIVPFQTAPEDFDAFWRRGREELATVPLEARLTLQPEACTDTVNVWHVSFRTVGGSWQAPNRIYGSYAEPKAPGRYPAVLKVPGAGVRPYGGDAALAARGAVVLEIGVHGIPVNQPREIYDQLLGGALANYWTANLDNPETYYYRRVILSCLRANDFLVSRPAWNGRDLLVMGASQGGALAIATAALDERVTALQSTHPALCDLAAPLHGRAGGWPHPFQPGAAGAPAFHATPAKIATARYYDTVNFARRVRVPGFYIWGYNDETCPPTSTFAAYNVITAPKELAVEPEQAHSYPPEQEAAINRWVRRQLGLP